MDLKCLDKVLEDMGLDNSKKFVDGEGDVKIDHSGLVVIPFWIILCGIEAGIMDGDGSVDVPMRNANIIDAFLSDFGSKPRDLIIDGMEKGVFPFAFILNTKSWDKSGLYYRKSTQDKVRLKTKSKSKPSGYLVTLIDSIAVGKPQPNEVDGASFIGTNYILKKSPFRLNNQYKWTPNSNSGSRRFSVEYINKLLK